MALTTLFFAAPSSGAATRVTGAGFKIVKTDLEFILAQIKIAEAHQAAGGGPLGTSTSHTIANANALGSVVPSTNVYVAGSARVTDIASPLLMNGLRQVDGRNNNLTQGFSPWTGYGYLNPSAPLDLNYVAPGSKSALGAADQPFVRTTAPGWRNGDSGASYGTRTGNITDSSPRRISNLIADQSYNNPAARSAAGCGSLSACTAEAAANGTDGVSLLIKNTATNAGIAAPYNGIFTLFGQFFDHGLDLVGKSATDKIIVPIVAGDPLYDGCQTLRGCTQSISTGRTITPAGADAGVNTTTPWVDQNQTFTSHPSHQVFIRDYTCTLNGSNQCTTTPRPTGKLLDGATLGNIANWGEVKDQAAKKLGILLTDADVTNIPLLVTNEYGRFIPGPNGFPQLVKNSGGTITFVEGNPLNPTPTTNSVRIGHAFLDDIAHFAAPIYDANGALAPDLDTDINNYPGQGFYDDELLNAHFITGDGRGNENIGLTSIHTVFHAEHNRLWAQIQSVINADAIASGSNTFKNQWLLAGAGSAYNGEYLFQASRFITEMEYQHLVFGEFARKVQPAIKAFVAYDPTLIPDITAEFAAAVYRYGHSQLNENVDRKAVGGGDLSVPLLFAFLNPTEFNQAHTYNEVTGAATARGSVMDGEQAAGSVIRGMVKQQGNEIDEFVTGALRNSLLGAPLDLATLNIMRGRDTGMKSLNAIRRDLYGNANGTANGNTQLAPYESWEDFHMNLRHPDSIINFVAAYGTHQTILDATTESAKRDAAIKLVTCDAAVLTDPATSDCGEFMLGSGAWTGVNTGLEDIDLWIGGLAEARTQFGSMLGSTFDYFFKTQMENLQESDRFYYLGRLAGTNLVTQLETNFLSDIVMRNTDVAGIPADIFAVPQQTFDMDNLKTLSAAQLTALGITRLASGVYRYSGTAHTVFNGSTGNDMFATGSGDDTLRGDDGSDWINGGAGNDFAFGGAGNDAITDTSGTNILVGGDGNDYINGAGTDSYNGNDGDDFLFGGNFPNIMLASLGNDWIYGGSNNDSASGDDGDDWMEGGPGGDTLLGDNLGPAGVTLGGPGMDVLIGGNGDDLLDGLDGTDIFVPGVGSDLNTGGVGFDWATYFNDGQTGIEADLANLNPAPGAILPALADQFQEVEGLSGGLGDDFLSGDALTTLVPVAPATGTNVLSSADRLAIPGLASIFRAGVNTWDGNILLGGPGSDVIEGRGGNDLIDGDASISVWISIPASWGIAKDANAPAAPAINGVAQVLVSSMSAIRAKIQTLMTTTDPDAISKISIYRVVQTGSHLVERDVAVYTGALTAANYTLTFNADGTITVTDLRNGGGINEGTDTLRGIEVLRFNGVDYAVTAPTAPTGVTAVVNAATNSVAITWSASTAVGALPIVGYTATMTPSVGAARTCTTTGALTCTITGLTNGATYSLTVTARNPLTNPSAAQSVVVSAGPVAPVITSVLSGANAGEITVGFTFTVPSPGAPAITSITASAYDLAGAKVTPTCVVSAPTGGTGSCTITGLTPNTNYTIEVSASNGTTATPSTRSVQVLATPTGATASPAASATGVNISVTPTATINTSVQVTAQITGTFAAGTAPTGSVVWSTTGSTGGTFASASTVVDANGFARVLFNVGSAAATNVTVSGVWTSTDASVTLNGAAQSIIVSGVLRSGASLAPTNPVLTPSSRSVIASWTPAVGATSYQVRAFQTSAGIRIVSSCSTTSTTCVVKGLGKYNYWFEVVAINASGTSTPTARISAKPL